jgi:hypothetical protein
VRRRYRVALTGGALASAVMCVALLTALSSASEGPIGASLERLAAAVYSLEHRVRVRLSGAGRGRHLAWFEPYRTTPERLRHPDVVLLGAYDSNLPAEPGSIIRLERSIETTFPLVHIYTAWGDKAEHRFPVRLATMIWSLGSVPVVTWEPWLSVFDNARHPHLPLREQRDRHGLAAVARGDYDFYVDAWAADVASFGHPLFVRFAHEMNDPYRYPWGPQNNTLEQFVAAWRHVVERFRRAGVHNVLWIWSPHVAYEYWDMYYPGSEYVDWVATGVLNYGPIARWSEWWTFEEIFGRKYPRLAEFGKPVMIAEFGSLAVGGDRAGWYRDALADLPTRLPAVKALLLFNATDDQTVTLQTLDWTVVTDPAAAGAIRDAIRPWDPGRRQREAGRLR